jgi:glycosyltransferase involved in cell wall biosynthesis
MAADISVVIPTFRRPRQLVEALRSVLSQDVALDVLVVDDSPEGSGEQAVAEVADARVSYRRRPHPSGGNPSRVRNDGWCGARGRFIHFLDDDDRVAAGAYRDAIEAFERNPDRGVVFGRIEPFGSVASAVEHERAVFRVSTRRARRLARLGSRRCLVANQLYASPTLFVNSACLIRAGHVAQLGGYDERITVMEDVDFYTRAIREFGFVFLDRVLVEYRTGDPSIMQNLTDGRGVDDAYGVMYRKYRESHGGAELLALKVLAKAVVRWL